MAAAAAAAAAAERERHRPARARVPRHAARRATSRRPRRPLDGHACPRPAPESSTSTENARRRAADRRNGDDRPRRRARRQQGREPVDPRPRRHARTPDDHGLGAGADAQPASRHRPAKRGFRVQGAAAAPFHRYGRVAGRRHEDAHAADRQCMAEAAADRARSLRRARQADRIRDAGRRNRARSPGARPDQGSADPHGPQLGGSRTRIAGRAARRRQAREGHDPARRLARRRSHHRRGVRRRPRPRYGPHQVARRSPAAWCRNPKRTR